MNVYQGYELTSTVKNKDIYTFNKREFMGAMGSGVMTIALNGGIWEGFLTFIFVYISQYVLKLTYNKSRNYFMETMATSFIIATLSGILYRLHFRLDFNLVIIGRIHFLFPGVSLNSV